MKIATRLLLCIFLIVQIFVGTSIGFRLSDLWRKRDDYVQRTQVISLKDVKEKFVIKNSTELDKRLIYETVTQAHTLDDPRCSPGFIRDRRGICREVW